MEQPREPNNSEQERVYELRAGYEKSDSAIPPEVHRTAQEMEHEYGIKPSLEAILHFHPELLEDENRDALEELFTVFDTRERIEEQNIVDSATPESMHFTDVEGDFEPGLSVQDIINKTHKNTD